MLSRDVMSAFFDELEKLAFTSQHLYVRSPFTGQMVHAHTLGAALTPGDLGIAKGWARKIDPHTFNTVQQAVSSVGDPRLRTYFNQEPSAIELAEEQLRSGNPIKNPDAAITDKAFSNVPDAAPARRLPPDSRGPMRAIDKEISNKAFGAEKIPANQLQPSRAVTPSAVHGREELDLARAGIDPAEHKKRLESLEAIKKEQQRIAPPVKKSPNSGVGYEPTVTARPNAAPKNTPTPTAPTVAHTEGTQVIRKTPPKARAASNLVIQDRPTISEVRPANISEGVTGKAINIRHGDLTPEQWKHIAQQYEQTGVMKVVPRTKTGIPKPAPVVKLTKTPGIKLKAKIPKVKIPRVGENLGKLAPKLTASAEKGLLEHSVGSGLLKRFGKSLLRFAKMAA